MGNEHRSASHLWEQARRKIFSKRDSSPKLSLAQRRLISGPTPIDTSRIDDQRDGFYMYSQKILEQENQRRDGLALRSSDSTENSYTSAVMEQARYPDLPYTVGAAGWSVFASASAKHLNGMGDESLSPWISSVLGAYTKVYSISKLFVMVFMHYGVELENIPDGILYHLSRAEEIVCTDSIVDLVENVESLYHTLYARLIMEIANTELASKFVLDVRRMALTDPFLLPEPSHLHRILLLCKDVLEDPNLCSGVNTDLIQQHQAVFVHRAVDKAFGVGFILDDLIGYRRYALDVINNKSSFWSQKWGDPGVLYHMPPAEIIATQSEKYLAFVPRMGAGAVPMLALPFIDRESIHPDSWAREIVFDNRQATLAKLEGVCLGDLRLRDDRRSLMDLVREQKCICRAVCTCAWDCTADVERPCPCAERWLTLMVAKRRRSVGPLAFGPRCTCLAKILFRGLASLKADVEDIELISEMDRAFAVFSEEIEKQRTAAALSKEI